MNGSAPDQLDRRVVWAHLRVPVLAFVALVCLLAGIVLLGTLPPTRLTAFIEAGLDICMVAVVLLFSMEVREQPPLLRFASMLGFCWLAVLCGIIMLDYWTR